jgi:hypothetical protein
MVQPRQFRDDEDLPEPPQVRRLRLLVSSLMVVLIGGMVVVAVALVMKLGALDGPEIALAPDNTPAPVSATEFALPTGAAVVSVGRGPGEVLILTRDPADVETLRIFDADSGAEKSATPVTRE